MVSSYDIGLLVISLRNILPRAIALTSRVVTTREACSDNPITSKNWESKSDRANIMKLTHSVAEW